MQNFRELIGLVEGVVNFSDHQKEPKSMAEMTPDVRVGPYVIHAAKKSPESIKPMDYIVWIEGPERDDPDDWIDIRRYASGVEPEKVTGLPKLGGSPEEMTKAFSKFAKRADTLADYGQDKPPEVRLNPAWVLWRKKAILRMAKQFGLNDPL